MIRTLGDNESCNSKNEILCTAVDNFIVPQTSVLVIRVFMELVKTNIWNTPVIVLPDTPELIVKMVSC